MSLPRCVRKPSKSWLSQAVADIQAEGPTEWQQPRTMFQNRRHLTAIMPSGHVVSTVIAKLSADEETWVLKFVLKFGGRKVSLSLETSLKPTPVSITTLSSARPSRLPFRNDSPGSRWVRNFHRQHDYALKHAVSFVQSAKRFAALKA